MAQHATLQELVVNTRFRLSDPHEGTLGMIRYDRFTESVDEMKLLLNEAQRAIAVLCDSPTTSLLRSNKQRIQVISGLTEYPMRDDLLAMDYIRHIKKDAWRKIVQRDKGEFPKTDGKTDSAYYPNSQGFYRYWDIYGVGALEKLVGIVRQNSLNELHDAYSPFDGIRVGDIVHNISDGSQGEVQEITPGKSVLNSQTNEVEYSVGYIVIDSLAGGSANRFQEGDEYLISSVEEINETLHLYPKIEFDEVTTKVFTGKPDNWSVQDGFVLRAVDVNITSYPDTIEVDDRLVLEVLRDGRLASTSPASATSKIGIENGVNRFIFDERVFPEGILIAEDTDYSVRATVRNEQITINSIDVYAYGTNDFIEMDYRRLPEKMLVDSAICEIPPWALDLLYAQALELADMKITRARHPNPALHAVKMGEKQKVEDMLWNRAPRGTSNLQDDHYRSDINDADRNFVAYWYGGGNQ